MERTVPKRCRRDTGVQMACVVIGERQLTHSMEEDVRYVLGTQ